MSDVTTTRAATGISAAYAHLGKLDAGTLKLKVAASIVAISSIHLLKVFMDVKTIPNDKILWYVVLHMTFVLSALLLGLLLGHVDASLQLTVSNFRRVAM